MPFKTLAASGPVHALVYMDTFTLAAGTGGGGRCAGPDATPCAMVDLYNADALALGGPTAPSSSLSVRGSTVRALALLRDLPGFGDDSVGAATDEEVKLWCPDRCRAGGACAGDCATTLRVPGGGPVSALLAIWAAGGAVALGTAAGVVLWNSSAAAAGGPPYGVLPTPAPVTALSLTYRGGVAAGHRDGVSLFNATAVAAGGGAPYATLLKAGAAVRSVARYDSVGGTSGAGVAVGTGGGSVVLFGDDAVDGAHPGGPPSGSVRVRGSAAVMQGAFSNIYRPRPILVVGGSASVRRFYGGDGGADPSWAVGAAATAVALFPVIRSPGFPAIAVASGSPTVGLYRNMPPQ